MLTSGNLQLPPPSDPSSRFLVSELETPLWQAPPSPSLPLPRQKPLCKILTSWSKSCSAAKLQLSCLNRHAHGHGGYLTNKPRPYSLVAPPTIYHYTCGRNHWLLSSDTQWRKRESKWLLRGRLRQGKGKQRLTMKNSLVCEVIDKGGVKMLDQSSITSLSRALWEFENWHWSSEQDWDIDQTEAASLPSKRRVLFPPVGVCLCACTTLIHYLIHYLIPHCI